MTADSLATRLTLLLLMPSASAIAMPFEPSSGCAGIRAPWKSWLDSLRPLSECWPIEIFRLDAPSWSYQAEHPAVRRRRASMRLGAVRTCVA